MFRRLSLLCISLFACSLLQAGTIKDAKTLKPHSMSVLTFSPEGTLFIGDSKDSVVYAVDFTGEAEKPDPDFQKFAVADLEGKIASLLGADADDIMIHDMAIHPKSKEVFLAVSRGRKGWDSIWYTPNDVADAQILLKIHGEGEISEVSLAGHGFTRTAIPDPVSEDDIHRWKKTKLRADVVTDMAFHDNKLYVAGLSNEEFSSTLRVFNYPFDEKAEKAGIEIFHGAHGEWETNAPIRAFLPFQNEVLAAYLCTPLVKIPTKELKDGGKVRGTTIAELGSGNTPLDMVSYKFEGKDYILLANSNRAMMRFEVDKINAFKGSITKEAGAGEGVEFSHMRGFGVVQLDKFSDETLALLARQPSGKLSFGVLPVAYIR